MNSARALILLFALNIAASANGTDEALVERRIDADSHSRFKSRYDRELLSLRDSLADLHRVDVSFASQVATATDLFTILPRIRDVGPHRHRSI